MKQIVFAVTSILAGGAFLMVAAPAPPGNTTSTTAAVPGHSMLVSLSGKVSRFGGNYLLTDGNTRTTFELRGADLKKYVGKNVKIQGQVLDGDPTIGGATHVVEVGQIIRVDVAGTAMSGQAAAAGAKTGISKAALATVVVGTATAGAVGGLYASGAIGSDDTPVSRP